MPWNAPLMLSTWRIAPALAAGNTIVLKPAEWSPLTATLLAEVLDEAELPPGVFNVVHGFGETAGRRAVVASRRPAHLLHGGDDDRARRSSPRGAPTLKRCSVELGGKSPVVVFEDADADRAVDAAVAQIFTLNGQRCTAGSRLLVQRAAVRADRRPRVAERARNVRVGDPFDPATELGPLIRPEHHARVIELHRVRPRAAARASWPAASAPTGLPDGNFLERDRHRRRRRGHARSSRRRSSARCSSRCRSTTRRRRSGSPTRREYGLAAYVWTNDIRRAHRVAHAIDTGLCWINSQNVRDLRTPFGGVKNSGDRPRGRRLRVRVLLRARDRARRAARPPDPAVGAPGPMTPSKQERTYAILRARILDGTYGPGAAPRDRRAGARPGRQPDAGARGDPPARGRGLAHLPAPPGRAGRAARRGRLDGGADHARRARGLRDRAQRAAPRRRRRRARARDQRPACARRSRPST